MASLSPPLKRRLAPDGSELIKCLSMAKKELCRQLNESNSRFHSDAEEKKLKVILDSVFKQKHSNAIIVMGDEDSGKEQFVDEVLNSYRKPVGDADANGDGAAAANGDGDEYRSAFRVARIRGLVEGSDELALLSLARQLFMERCMPGKFDENVESIESVFRTSYSSGLPTVIVIENIEEYCKGKKQILLYTLLDMMHRKDALFALIGITHKVNFDVRLEKRVSSRLNAQFVHLSPASSERICRDLHSRLLLSPMSFPGDERSKQKIATSSSEINRKSETFKTYTQLDYDPRNDQAQIKEEKDVIQPIDVEAGGGTGVAWELFRTNFNDQVESLFGDNPSSSSSSESSSSESIMGIVQGYVDHGRGVTFFLRAALTTVLHLTSAEPYLTVNGLQRALAALDPPCSSFILNGFSLVEVYFLAAITRLTGAAYKAPFSQRNMQRSKAKDGNSDSTDIHGGSSSIGGDSSGSSRSSSFKSVHTAASLGMASDGSFSLSRIIQEFDRLCGFLRNKTIARSHLMHAGTMLAEMRIIIIRGGVEQIGRKKSAKGSLVLTEGIEARVSLLIDLDEIRIAFALLGVAKRNSGAHQSHAGEHSLPEYILRAVLEPLEAIEIPTGTMGLVV